jgi:predicted ATPase
VPLRKVWPGSDSSPKRSRQSTKGLARAEHGGERWYVPELLRIKGELLIQNGGEFIPATEDCLTKGFGVAHEQGALFWELSAATSLARLRVRLDRHEDARRFLTPVYDRFTEGFETADVRSARAMLEKLPSRRASD